MSDTTTLHISNQKILWEVEYFNGNLTYHCSDPKVPYPNWLLRQLLKIFFFSKVTDLRGKEKEIKK